MRFYAIYKLMLCISGIQLSADISLTVYSLCNISDINIVKLQKYSTSRKVFADWPKAHIRDWRDRTNQNAKSINMKLFYLSYSGLVKADKNRPEMFVFASALLSKDRREFIRI